MKPDESWPDQAKIEVWVEKQIQQLAIAWKKGEADWRVVADHLLNWDTALSMQEGAVPRGGSPDDSESQIKRPADGLGKYVKRLADALTVQKSNLWRYRKAALAARIIWSGHSVDSPLDIPEHASPESIELVEKIFRAAPTEVAEDVARRLYDNEITRAELRRIWQDIRHVVDKPVRPFVDRYRKLPEENPVRVSALFEEICFNALCASLQSESMETVLGGKGRCFRGVQMLGKDVDIVAVTEDQDGSALLHAIEVWNRKQGTDVIDHLRRLRECFDKTWIVVPGDIATSSGDIARIIPPEFGILRYDDGALRVFRSAQRTPHPDLNAIRRLLPQILR